MRLIDADELTTAFPLGEYVRTECVQATIDYMQTIDAIPVEWLRDKAADKKSGIMYGATDVLAAWEDEQEAR